MAQISANVLQSLSDPFSRQGMFQLGQALGGIPSQYRAKKEEEQFNEIMKMGQAAMASNDPVNLSRVAQQLASLGYAREAQRFSDAAKAANQKMAQTEGSKGLMAAISSEEGFTPEVEQSLIESGITPSQILSGKEERRATRIRKQKEDSERGKLALQRYVSAKKMDLSTDEAKEGFYSIADAYKLDPTYVDQYWKLVTDKPEARGSRAAPSIRTIFNEQKNYNEDVAVYRNDEGDIVTEVIGRSEVEAADPRDTGLRGPTGLNLYNTAVNEAREASEQTAELRELVRQAEDLAGVPLGGVPGRARNFVISDIAGLADEYSYFRTQLNKQQMQSAIALLPRGPASDRDVALALSASANLNDYNAEDRIRILRGMVKLQEARERYLQERRAYMSQTADPIGLGYEEYSQAVGLEDQRIAFEQDYSVQVQKIKEMLRALPEDETAAEQALQVIREEEKLLVQRGELPASYLSMLEAEDNAVQQWQRVKDLNDIPISLP